MKGPNMNNKNQYTVDAKRYGFSAVSLNSGGNLIAKIDIMKQRLFRKFSAESLASDRVLKGALNEAEALAWQTPFPHLFFPELAQEKAVAASQWTRRQEQLQAGMSMAFAA
jgi:hypothetical protein